MITEAYPLQWPAGWPRTPRTSAARFNTRFAVARDGIFNELRLMNARGIVMSSNLDLRIDGLPYANQKQPEDRGVAVYFIREGEQKCIPCDRWNRVEDNAQAIRQTVGALRGLERWGAKQMVDAAFTGFTAIGSGEHWSDVLGVDRDATTDDIKSAYRKLARDNHPDHGGDAAQFHRIAEAFKQGVNR